MSAKSKFLTLSMRQLISLTIILLSLFSFMVVLSISGPLIYETLKADYKLKKLYFHKKFKEFFETCFFFHNFCLLKYEEIIKRIQKQIWVFNGAGTTYRTIFSSEIFIKELSSNPVINYFKYNKHDAESINDTNENLYYLCYCTGHPDNYNTYKKIFKDIGFNETFINNLNDCEVMKYFLSILYESYCSLIFTHNIEKALHLHEFEMPIMTAPLFVYTNDSIMFSFNYSRIDENKKNIFGDSAFDEVKLKNYYNNYVVKNMLSTIKGFFLKFFNNELFLFRIIFVKAVKEIMETIYQIHTSQFSPSNENAINKLIEENCGFYSTINYANSKFALLSHDVKGFSYYETTIVDNYLYYVHNKLSEFLNISFIPLYAENNTIMSPELCLSFLLKQLNYQVDENKINELYKDMIKGQSTIEKCFIDKNIFDEQLEIKDISVSNEYISFLNVSNVINQGLIEIDGNPYYFIKYSYPNIVSLLDFSSDYILLDQINFYLFISFKEPEEIVHSIFIVYKNCFL